MCLDIHLPFCPFAHKASQRRDAVPAIWLYRYRTDERCDAKINSWE